jgi:hypothetical protein
MVASAQPRHRSVAYFLHISSNIYTTINSNSTNKHNKG